MVELHIGRWIEIEDQHCGRFGIGFLAAPGMKFETCSLGELDQSFFSMDFEERLFFARDIDLAGGLHPFHRVALEEALAIDALWRAHKRKRAARGEGQDARGGQFIIGRKVGFGDGGMAPVGRPQLLFGVADDDTGHAEVVVFRRPHRKASR